MSNAHCTKLYVENRNESAERIEKGGWRLAERGRRRRRRDEAKEVIWVRRRSRGELSVERQEASGEASEMRAKKKIKEERCEWEGAPYELSLGWRKEEMKAQVKERATWKEQPASR